MIGVDFTFDLGGDTTFEAGIDKKDEERLRYSSDLAVTTFVPSKETTLQVAIAFSF